MSAKKSISKPAKTISDPNMLKMTATPSQSEERTVANMVMDGVTGKPWEQSTEPKTPEGRLRVARNAWRGGHLQQLRELSKLANEDIRRARKLVASV